LHYSSGLIGVDPGTVNMGIAISFHNVVILAQVFFEREKDAVVRMVAVQDCVKRVLNYILFEYPCTLSIATIEGASYGDRYRQVEMAENRIAIAQGLLNAGLDEVKIIPPLSIRKKVFGSAKLKAHDVWDNTEIPNDALAALSCLYYADMMENENVEK
jgi:hypothetical protein